MILFVVAVWQCQLQADVLRTSSLVKAAVRVSTQRCDATKNTTVTTAAMSSIVVSNRFSSFSTGWN
jgi:hypothetical protein